jgi:MULE transposase domain
VLAEVDGVGFPLSYMLLTTTTAITEGARTTFLVKFLDGLRQKGVNPRFAMTDKDPAQIRAVKTVWSSTYIQLCYWHLKKAVKKQMASTKRPQVMRYAMNEAKMEFSFIDLNFYPNAPTTSTSTSTFLLAIEDNTKATTNQTSCHTKNKAAFTYCPSEHRNHILRLMVKHLHQHPFIPALGNQYYTSEQIREEAVKEMYTYCKENDLAWAWAYLWVEWYSKEKWKNWARSCKSDIPVLKTTMIVESHWRIIKRDYLYKFHKPRLDLLIWVLASRLVPRCIIKYQHLISSRQRTRYTPSWRPVFKRAWKECSRRTINDTSYITDSVKWTCSCPAYLESRFLLCKHLVQSVRPVGPIFFNEVHRRRSPPFWQHPDLIPLEIEANMTKQSELESGEEADEENTDISDAEDETDEENMDISDMEDEMSEGREFDESWEYVYGSVEQSLEKWKELLNSQKEFKDVRFWSAANEAMKGMEKMRMKCEKIDNKRTLPRTWKDNDPQTMFYRARKK